ncbi:hypothetical protein GUJ93_ZPchr0008g14132 [Zizania palustris]|uniref:Uncharacterized protein n=1 Tax=Zizania palustris TaxID=103762 RepID=A0A8J5V0S6_ZIZPA|nr:hypothetical protein GUJ93_ZPchr0008g14132 [Zizania palustris]
MSSQARKRQIDVTGPVWPAFRPPAPLPRASPPPERTCCLLLPLTLTTWLTRPARLLKGSQKSLVDRWVGPASLNHCTGKGSTWTGDVEAG